MNYTKFQCNIDIVDNPLNLNIEEYLDVALRNNKKRKFLFISKKLGKHLACSPKEVDELGKLLSNAYKLKQEDFLKEKQLVIGFAETATSLSHSFFNYLETAEFFIHTTRQEVPGFKKIEFKEEHSHAIDQCLYIDNITNIKDMDTVVLVDDEITTANTCINMIKELQKQYKVKKYVIASLLNWINKERAEEIREIALNLNCEIEFVYLFNGKFNFNLNEATNIEEEVNNKNQNISSLEDKDISVKYMELDLEKYIHEAGYIKYTGRFGIDRVEQNEIKNIVKREGRKLNYRKRDYKILALGVEEFMYIPMLLSKEIKGDVYYHSITRSPIKPIKESGYPIKNKHELTSFYNDNINYLYNLDIHKYEECFLFIEICKDESRIHNFINIIKSLGIRKINIVRC